MEVKGSGDVVAELIKAAKDTYISTLLGKIDITKVISGDSLFIGSLGGGIKVDDIVTLNPEADINLFQWLGDMKISNASSTRNLEFTNLNGVVTLDKVYAGKDINVTSGWLMSEGTDISLNNSYAGNDIKLSGGFGNVNISNTTVGNNFDVYLNGNMEIANVNVGNNTKISTYNNSFANINKFKSDSLDLTDSGNSSLNIAESVINKANVELGCNLNIIKSNIKDLNTRIVGDLTVNQFGNSRSSIVVKGNTNISNLTSDELTAQIGGNTQITDSSIGSIDAKIGGDLTVNQLGNSRSY